MRKVTLALLIGAASATGIDGQQVLRVFVANFAQVEEARFQAAVQVAEKIFVKAEVPVEMVICTASNSDGFLRPACPVPIRKLDAFLRVIAEPVSSEPVSSGALGWAMQGKSGQRGGTAYVYYSRVSQVAETGSVATSCILGHALAHEIGHLLGTGHASSGLMMGGWRARQIKEASRGLLLFAPEQAAQMREVVEK